MNLADGPAHQEFLVAQWLECPTGIWEAIGSTPVGVSIFFFSVLSSMQDALLHMNSLNGH